MGDQPEDTPEEPERTFSVAEANQLIPVLQDHLTHLQQARTKIRQIHPEISRASARAALGGGSLAGALYVQTLEELSSSLQALQETGVLLKDAEIGLCDFPHLHDGRIVYLCWQLGESRVSWWHEVAAGYRDRQPIDTLG